MNKQQRTLTLWASFWLVLAGLVLAMSIAMMSTFGLATTVLAWMGGVVSTVLFQHVRRLRAV